MKYFLIMFIMLWATSVFAAPQWVEKPVQCASPSEVFDRLDEGGLEPLFAATGNARVGNEIYTKTYGMFYNEENSYWAFVEFFDAETMCMVVVGEGIEFDVQN